MAVHTVTGGSDPTMRPFLYVGNAAVKQVLTPADAVRLAEETLRDHANDDVDWADPRQTDLWPRDDDTKYKVKGCVLRRHGVAGFRVTGLNRTAEGKSYAAYRPSKHVLLSDVPTGTFFGIVDERWGYGLRTGAGAAMGVKLLRRPGADSCAVLGTGHMAYGSLLALNEVLDLRRVTVWSRTAERREAFAERMSDELGVDVVPASQVEACVRDQPVVVAATEAREPIVRTEWLAPGVTVYALGRFQEFELSAYRELTFLADDREQIRVCAEIKDLIARGRYTDDWVQGELAEVIGGRHPGRRHDDERIFIRSQGLVTMDVAQAYWVYGQAHRRGLGLSLEPALVEDEGAPLF